MKLVSATEVISAGPEGIILESVLEGYAEYYSADLSEKVVRGMTENALKGIHLLVLCCKTLVGNTQTLELHRADAGCAIASLKNISKMPHSADEN